MKKTKTMKKMKKTTKTKATKTKTKTKATKTTKKKVVASKCHTCVCGRSFLTGNGLGGHSHACAKAIEIRAKATAKQMTKKKKKSAQSNKDAPTMQPTTIKKRKKVVASKNYTCVCGSSFSTGNGLGGHSKACAKAIEIRAKATVTKMKKKTTKTTKTTKKKKKTKKMLPKTTNIASLLSSHTCKSCGKKFANGKAPGGHSPDRCAKAKKNDKTKTKMKRKRDGNTMTPAPAKKKKKINENATGYMKKTEKGHN